MASFRRIALESLLQSKKLDRSLTTAIRPEIECASTGITALDARLWGGFPRGELSELIGPRSSGRSTTLLHALAAATRRGELVALVDALDMFDVSSAVDTGVDLDRLLWIRGHVVTNPGFCRDLNHRALTQALRALTLVLQAGNFGLVAFDLAEAPPDAVRRLPFTTWVRLQRMVEGSHTACVLIASNQVARSSAGLTIEFGVRSSGGLRHPASAVRFKGCLFEGLDVDARVIRARAGWEGQGDVRVSFSTTAC